MTSLHRPRLLFAQSEWIKHIITDTHLLRFRGLGFRVWGWGSRTADHPRIGWQAEERQRLRRELDKQRKTLAEEQDTNQWRTQYRRDPAEMVQQAARLNPKP